MKIATAAVLLAFACAAARAADAPAPRPEAPPERSWRVAGEYLYYLPSNSGSGLSNQLDAQAIGLIAGGYDSAERTVTTAGGAGGRLSLMRRWDQSTSLGFSLDYVLGPTMNADFKAYSAAFGNGGLTINRAVTYVRLLGQSHIRFLGRDRRRQGDWELEMEAAFGPGVGHVDQTCQATGSLTCPLGSANLNWVGIAWEFGPRVSVRLRDVDVGGAVLVAGFPRYKGNDDVAPLEWQTMGFALSAEF